MFHSATILCPEVEHWRQYKADEFINDNYRCIYEIMAGNTSLSVTGEPGTRSRLDICIGLDWKRSFCVQLWYGNNINSSIEDAIRSYTESFTTQHSAPPLPSWSLGFQRKRLSRTLSDWMSQAPQDVTTSLVASKERDAVYQMLLLYSDPTYALESALLPRAFGSSRADMLMPYMFAWMFNRVKSLRGFEEATLSMDLIITQLASQLEQLGLYEWAAFTLLHLSSSQQRETTILDLLVRSVKPSTTSVDSLITTGRSPTAIESWPVKQDIQSADWATEFEIFVVTKLKIPISWLYEAKAIRACYDRNWTECHASNTPQLSTSVDDTDDPSSTRPKFAWGPWRDSSKPTAEAVRPIPSASSSLLTPLACSLLDETRWLLLVGRFHNAHSLVMCRIAPDAILRGDYDLLSVVSYLH